MSDIDLLRFAYQIASVESDDPDTQNGAVLLDANNHVIAHSANHFARGVAKSPERLQRPAKYTYMVHAERGAVYRAAANGKLAAGCTLVVPWFACADCAQAIIEAGIACVLGHQDILDKTPERWRETIAVADAMLDEAGVQRLYVEGSIGGVEIMFNGELWKP